MQRCEEETQRFFQRQPNDARFCFELFRRAVLDGNQHAWTFLYRQYRPLVLSWIKRHPGFQDTGEEVDYFLNRAYERLWSALEPEKFEKFPDLRSILRYLQMCVHSVITDDLRRHEREELDLEDHATQVESDLPAIEDHALRRLEREELWHFLEAKLNDENEKVCVYASFVLGFKPRHIHEHFASIFSEVEEVYLVKQNVIARLRRDPEIEERFLAYD
jgi:RNA polymerase sigma factor (sigma-70 family)